MHRFFVPVLAGDRVDFSPDQARQMVTVLRMVAPIRVVVFDGSGEEFDVEIAKLGRTNASGVIVDRRQAMNEPALQVVLYQSLIKGEKLDWVVQKAVEIGVHTIVPIMSSRCVAVDMSDQKRARLQRIAIEAAEQSERSHVPRIEPLIDFRQALQALDYPAWLAFERTNIAVPGLTSATPPNSSTRVGIFIGPEGGYDPAEVNYAAERGVRAVSLGPRILRSETAAVVAVTLCLAHQGTLT